MGKASPEPPPPPPGEGKQAWQSLDRVAAGLRLSPSARFHGPEGWLLCIPAMSISHSGSRASFLCCFLAPLERAEVRVAERAQEGEMAVVSDPGALALGIFCCPS